MSVVRNVSYEWEELRSFAAVYIPNCEFPKGLEGLFQSKCRGDAAQIESPRCPRQGGQLSTQSVEAPSSVGAAILVLGYPMTTLATRGPVALAQSGSAQLGKV